MISIEEEEEEKQGDSAGGTKVNSNRSKAATTPDGRLQTSFPSSSSSPSSSSPQAPYRPLPPMIRFENMTTWPLYFAQRGIPLSPHPHAKLPNASHPAFPYRNPTSAAPSSSSSGGEKESEVKSNGEDQQANSTTTSSSSSDSPVRHPHSRRPGSTDNNHSQIVACCCDELLPFQRTNFAWDAPCPPPGRREECLAIRLSLAPLPASSGGALLTDLVVGSKIGSTLRGCEAAISLVVRNSLSKCFAWGDSSK